ncbi:hypothetical protein HBI56_087540 [Parastagonospora nodorum]|nr:hypothetical protein HBH47_152350 [Parastagonospora nodorum]KAH4605005.1 hypothetical protein HBH82_126300 [Parastagonospora nodorum]KAH4688211.1 hypothetical protein HBH78_102560 [Parastagonospora nodorum]KAH4707003.1 hypothetical protein HBH67_080540 [Parastagonospora nodorum]KAH4779068.1 hypothetical protein HBH62_144410 [Parastagonospora nodorum]
MKLWSVKSVTCEQVIELRRGREGLISGQLSGYARPRSRALEQGVPASCGASSRSEWLSAVIHCADQGFLGIRFAEFPPEDDFSF